MEFDFRCSTLLCSLVLIVVGCSDGDLSEKNITQRLDDALVEHALPNERQFRSVFSLEGWSASKARVVDLSVSVDGEQLRMPVAAFDGLQINFDDPDFRISQRKTEFTMLFTAFYDNRIVDVYLNSQDGILFTRKVSFEGEVLSEQRFLSEPIITTSTLP
ncbi:hypothetical protein [Cerasicoccus frondis]|uniref:hypothetical protein n=1 Tax=Cerasicoccus frondis TaxID=490090 RepID=UPI0028528FF4|nr:hypothetical protein [Cerasicoccus frondis]